MGKKTSDRRYRIVLCAWLCASAAFLSGADGSLPRSGAQASVPSRTAEVHAAEMKETRASEISAERVRTSDFLKSTGLSAARDYLPKDVTATIAIVDTGVDFNHPGLKPYLLPGKNLLDERKPPQDDNGHGTAVAGVIAAVAASSGSGEGAAGSWKGKILPVKALDENGAGDEKSLTDGIAYAVGQGADIVVLSLGLLRDAPGLREVVELAEAKGVLLVAASGNDAAQLGDVAAVQYPAAYDSVLAVAGSEVSKAVAQSNAGPEVDLSAAWRVDTFKPGGGEAFMEGTSMGAPQAAAAAAMLMVVHPDWKPLRIRETLRRTAIKKEASDWNPHTGYGYLSAIDAVKADELADWREPNDVRWQAFAFPIGKEVAGTWGRALDQDWFNVDLPYDGVFSVTGDAAAQLSLYGIQGLVKPIADTGDAAKTSWRGSKGRYWLRATPGDGGNATYRLASRFEMPADAREPNDVAASAFTIAGRSQQWTGSFHRAGDEDWTVFTLPKPGLLRITATADTSRIDLGMLLQPAGGTPTVADEEGGGGFERIVVMGARAGKYYFRIRNELSANQEPVIGTYTVALEYITQYEDAFEPNNGALSATPSAMNKIYRGLIGSKQDQDWFRFSLKGKADWRFELNRVSEGATVKVALKDKKLRTLAEWSNADNQTKSSGFHKLAAGNYYVVVTSDRPIQNRPYELIFKMQKAK